MTALRPHPHGIPLPQPTLISQPFWDGCARGELMFQRCTRCERPVFNPAPICRWCTSRDLAWERSSGAGCVYSWSTVWRPQTPAFDTPYVAAIIDVDEGYQMVANIIGCEPDDVCCGMKVAVEFHSIGSGISLPYFRPGS
jgi:uncharacterized OB-fold protein